MWDPDLREKIVEESRGLPPREVTALLKKYRVPRSTFKSWLGLSNDRRRVGRPSAIRDIVREEIKKYFETGEHQCRHSRSTSA